VGVRETVDAKAKLGAAEALKHARQADRVIVAKGKKVTIFDMKKDAPDNETLLKHMLGPTGNLRAPTISRGKSLLVGFNEEVYAKTLG
jgi:arsenate reductase-like glutaredoxin family protein